MALRRLHRPRPERHRLRRPRRAPLRMDLATTAHVLGLDDADDAVEFHRGRDVRGKGEIYRPGD